MAPASRKRRPPKVETLVRRLVADVLQYLGVDVDFRLLPRGPYAFTVVLWGPDVDMLRKSSDERIWNALRFLLQQMASRGVERAVDIRLEAAAEDPRKLELEALARRAAREALRRGKPVFLPPMSAWERRIIHLTLQDHPQVYTRSQGREPNRRVGVFPRTQNRPARKGGDRKR